MKFTKILLIVAMVLLIGFVTCFFIMHSTEIQ